MSTNEKAKLDKLCELCSKVIEVKKGTNEVVDKETQLPHKHKYTPIPLDNNKK